LCFVFVATKLWWHELLLAMETDARISDNKAGARSSSVLVYWRDTRQPSPSFFDKLPRRKVGEVVFGTGSFNKRCWVDFGILVASLDLAAMVAEDGWWWLDLVIHGEFLLRFGVPHMVALVCHRDLWLMRQPLQAPMASIQPPWRRPFEGFLLAFIALAAPSGSVPGAAMRGWQWSSFYGGEDGPDCFSCNLSRVLSVIFEDCFVFSFFSGFLCTLYSHRQN
jgi:hypothetical protein